MDRNTLFDCLVAWVNTFDLNVKCENANDFKDGIVIAKCLNYIDPEYFGDEWVSKIKDDTNENWRLKLLNLKKILQRITDYYSEVLNCSLSDFEMPNLNLIVETNNNINSIDANNQLSHLLQLVLGCAVNCERKSEFIKNIMEMNESTQHMIMTAIQELMSKDRNMNLIKQSTSSLSIGLNADDDLNYQLKKALIEVNRINELKEDIEMKCKRLDKQVSELQDEKMALLSEMDVLKSKLQREDLNRTDSNNDLNKQLRLQQKIETMQEELYKLESEKEKYRIQFEAAKAEQDLLIEKNIELKKLAQEHQTLKDEIDILKHTSDKVEKLESTIEMYKIKLEEMVDLKKQIKLLEENNTKYLEKILVMEDETKKINTLKSQIEMYKKQMQELHEKMLNDEMKMKKLEYEYKSVEEKCTSLKVEKERAQLEYERLKESYEQLNINSKLMEETNSQNSPNEDSTSNQIMEGLFTTAELLNITSEIKEKIIRLHHENKLLKSKQNEFNEERLLLVQNMYEDEKQRNQDLQSKLNETSKAKIEIECQLNDLINKENEIKTISAAAAGAAGSGDSPRDELINDLKLKLTRAQSQLEEESKRSELSAKKLEEKIEQLRNEKNELKDIKDKEIQSKEKEINELNEKYRGYLEKAKIVIKSLDPRNSTNGNSEAQFLKTQLAEKEKLIKQLTKENEKIRNSREQEERLIASAWYKLGANLNRRSTDDRISSIGSSFLSQQRHLPNMLSPNSSNSLSSTISSNSTTPKRANQLPITPGTNNSSSKFNSSPISTNQTTNLTNSASMHSS